MASPSKCIPFTSKADIQILTVKTASLDPTSAPFRPRPYPTAGLTPASSSPDPLADPFVPRYLLSMAYEPETPDFNSGEQENPIPEEYRSPPTTTRPPPTQVATISPATSAFLPNQPFSYPIPPTILATSSEIAHLPPRPEIPAPVSNSAHHHQHQQQRNQRSDQIAYTSPFTGATLTRPELETLARGEKTNARGDPVYFKPSFIDPDPWAIFRKKRELKKMVMREESEGDGENQGARGMKYSDVRKEEGGGEVGG